MATRHVPAIAVSPVAGMVDRDTPWYTRAAAAAYASVNSRTIDKARRTGELAASRIAGRGRYRYHRNDLDRWIGAGRFRVLAGGAAW